MSWSRSSAVVGLACAATLSACWLEDTDCPPDQGIWEGPEAWGVQVGTSRGHRIVYWNSSATQLAEVSADLATVEPRALPGDGLAEPIPEAGVSSRLFSGDGGHLVVSLDQTGHRIVALALASDGTPVDKWTTVRAWDPQDLQRYTGLEATWTGGAWAVSWIEQRPVDASASFVMRVRADGSLVDAEPLELGLVGVFGDGRIWLVPIGDVTWAMWRGPAPFDGYDILGRRIDTASWTVVDDEPITLLPQSGTPAFAIDGDRGLLLALDNASPGVIQRFLDATGPIGETSRIADEVLWYQTIRGLFSIDGDYVAIFDAEARHEFPGEPLTTTLQSIAPDGSPPTEIARVGALDTAIAFDGRHLFLADVEDDTDGDRGTSRVRVRTLSADGTVVSEGTVETNEMDKIGCTSPGF